MSPSQRPRKKFCPRVETLENRRLLAATNPIEPLDVSGDFQISPIDVLQVVNAIRSNNSASPIDDGPSNSFVDVDGNGSVQPLDALLVINSLRSNGNQDVAIDREPASAEFGLAEAELIATPGDATRTRSVLVQSIGGANTISIFGNDVSLRLTDVGDGRVRVESLATATSDPAGVNGDATFVELDGQDDLNIVSFADDVSITLDGLTIGDDVRAELLGRRNSLEIFETTITDDLFASLGRGIGDNAIELDDVSVGDDLLIDAGVASASVTLGNTSVGDDLRFRGGLLNDNFDATDVTVGDEVEIRSGRGNDVVDGTRLTALDQVLIDTAGGDDRVTLTESTAAENLVFNSGDGSDRVVIDRVTVGGTTEAESDGGLDDAADSVLVLDSVFAGDLEFDFGGDDSTVAIDGTSIAGDLRTRSTGIGHRLGVTDSFIGDDLRVATTDATSAVATTETVIIEGQTLVLGARLVDATDDVAEVAFDVIASSGSGTPNGITIPAPTIIPGDRIGNVRRFDGRTGDELPAFATEFENGLLDPRDLILTGPITDPSTTLFVNTADFNNPAAPPTDGVIDIDGTLEFALDGTFLRTVSDFIADQTGPVSAGGGVFAPSTDPSDDADQVSFFIGSRVQGDILEIDPATGALIGSVAGTEDISFPRGFVFGPDGDLFLGSGSNPATGAGDNSILRIDPQTGESTVFFSTEQTGIEFSPLDVILSADGQSIITSSESPFSPGVPTPSTVLIIPINFEDADDVVVLDPGFDDQGEPILVDPRGLGIGPDGLLYVSSAGNDTILRFDADTGEFLDVFASAAGVNAQAVTFVPATRPASPIEQFLTTIA